MAIERTFTMLKPGRRLEARRGRDRLPHREEGLSHRRHEADDDPAEPRRDALCRAQRQGLLRRPHRLHDERPRPRHGSRGGLGHLHAAQGLRRDQGRGGRPRHHPWRLCFHTGLNVIHASDSSESAAREIGSSSGPRNWSSGRTAMKPGSRESPSLGPLADLSGLRLSRVRRGEAPSLVSFRSPVCPCRRLLLSRGQNS